MNIKKILVHLVSLAVLLGTLCVAFVFIRTNFVAPATGKTNGYFLNDVFDSPSVALVHGETVSQDFKAADSIYGVRVRFHNQGIPQAGTILAQLADKNTGEILAETVANSGTMLNDAYSAIHFDTPYTGGTGEYTLLLTPTFENPNAYMRIWADTASGTIAFGLINYIADADTVYSWFGLLWVITLAAAVVIYLACFVFPLKKETVFAVVLVAVSVLFTMVLPPYASPDEEAHIGSAYQLHNKWQGYKSADFMDENGIESKVYFRGEDFSDIMEDKYTTVFTYEYIWNNFFDMSDDDTVVETVGNWLIYDFDAIYVMGALGISLGKLMGLGFVPMLYLGRLFNLLFFALCGYIAVKITPTGKEVFMTLSFLPITLHLANSFSRDVFVISMGFVFVAYLLKLFYQQENYSIKQLVLIAVIAVLLAPSKFIYCVMCPLVLLLHREKLSFGIKWKFKFNPLLLALPLAAVALVILYISNTWVFHYVFGSLFNVQPLEQLMAENPSATFNIMLLLKNPVVALNLFVNTLFANGAYYIKSVAGGVLGYNSIYISDAFIMVILAMVVISTFCMPEDRYTLKTREKVGFGLSFALVFALVVYVAVTWTPVVDKTIYGIQGKYLLPAMPLLLVLCKNKTFKITKDIFKPVCFVMAATDIFVVLNALVVILQR